MNDITNLTEVLCEPDPRVVALLEDVLEKAKKGEVRAVAIVGEMAGETAYSWEGDSYFALYVGLDALKLHMLEGE